MTIKEKLYTAAELWNLPQDGTRYELIRGKLIEISPTGSTHGLLTIEIGSLIYAFVKQNKLGQVFGAETGFKLAENPDTVYGIDVAFVSKARAQKTEGYFLGAPDFAIEVVSPGNSKAEMHEKVRDLFQAGTRLVWIVYPKSRTIYVYHAENRVEIRHETDSLDGNNVLPGFLITGSAIFSVLEE